MDNQTLIIFIIVFFLLGCQFSCRAVEKENFGHGSKHNCRDYTADICKTIKGPAYDHCCDSKKRPRPIQKCKLKSIFIDGEVENCSQCIGVKAGQIATIEGEQWPIGLLLKDIMVQKGQCCLLRGQSKVQRCNPEYLCYCFYA